MLRIAVALVVLAASPAFAQDWPQRPIKMLVGFGAGGGTDIIARIVAQPLSEMLGQPIIIENKSGAGSTLASNEVSKAPKDGYTMGGISAGHTVGSVMIKNIQFDPVKDFAPVGQTGTSALVVVARKDFTANDIQSLIALAKKDPGKLNFGSVGVGSTQHFAAELFRQMAGLDVKHIPYRGTPAVVTALRTGEIDYAVELLQTVIGQVEAGELKLIAVASGERWPTIPNVPTVAESGVPSYEVATWYGIVFPAGVPQAIVDKTSKALQEILARPAIQEQMKKGGALARFSTPAQFTRHLDDEIAKWKSVREKAGLEAN